MSGVFLFLDLKIAVAICWLVDVLRVDIVWEKAVSIAFFFDLGWLAMQDQEDEVLVQEGYVLCYGLVYRLVVLDLYMVISYFGVGGW